jgi:hypothetical protein
MLSWILQITIISLVLIFLVHHLIQFFKETLTIPKVKDLINSPNQKYETMFLAMNKRNENYDETYDENYRKKLLPVKVNEFDAASMKNELKDYLKSQNTRKNNLGFKNKIKVTELL